MRVLALTMMHKVAPTSGTAGCGKGRDRLLAPLSHRDMSRETPVKSLFAAMVDVAREQRGMRKQLNANELWG